MNNLGVLRTSHSQGHYALSGTHILMIKEIISISHLFTVNEFLMDETPASATSIIGFNKNRPYQIRRDADPFQLVRK